MANKSLWEKKGGRSFLGDLDKGKQGEARVMQRLKQYRNVKDVKDISTEKRGKDDDIDCIVEFTDGHETAIEIKCDFMAHKTGNIVFEEQCHKTPGCFVRTKADHIMYLVEQTGEVYVLDPEAFRGLIAETKEDKLKAQALGIRPTRMGQGEFGYLVPIDSLEKEGVVECVIKAA